MKTIYRLGEDLFISTAFVSFIVAVVLKLVGIKEVFYGITLKNMLTGSVLCLLFSIALGVYDLNLKK